MKRLLAYLFIVLGLGLTFSVSAEAAVIEVCTTSEKIKNNRHVHFKEYETTNSIPTKKTNLIKSELYKCEIFTNYDEQFYNAFKEFRKYKHKTPGGWVWDGSIWISRYKSLLEWKGLKSKILKPIQIAKAEPSQTQKVANSNKENTSPPYVVFCKKKYKDSSFADYRIIYSNKIKDCKYYDGQTGYMISASEYIHFRLVEALTPDGSLSDGERTKVTPNSLDLLFSLFRAYENYGLDENLIAKVASTEERFYVYKKAIEKNGHKLNKALLGKKLSGQTQIAKAESTLKPKKTNIDGVKFNKCISYKMSPYWDTYTFDLKNNKLYEESGSKSNSSTYITEHEIDTNNDDFIITKKKTSGTKYNFIKFRFNKHNNQVTKTRIDFRDGEVKKIDGVWTYVNYREDITNHVLSCDKIVGSFKDNKTQIAKAEPTVKPKKKVKVVKKEPKQEEFKPKKTNQDNEAPIITIAEAITVDSQAYTLKGKVKDKSRFQLTIDDRPIKVAKNGQFKFEGFAIDSKEQLKIVAIDRWKNKSEKIINVEVKIKQVADLRSYEKPNPSKIKVKKDNNKIGIIIGIEKYQNLNNIDAPYANRDAKAFKAYANIALGIPNNNLKVLIDEDATRGELLKSLKIWLPQITRGKEKDIYIFFAGHGLASDDGKDLHILPHNGDPILLEDTALSRIQMFDLINKVSPKSVTMFFDTCYSGQTRSEQMLVAGLRPVRIVADEQDTPNNFTIFTASNYDQTSGSINEAEHGIFSYYLMKGLEGNADANKDKELTNGELIAYLKNNVSQEAFTQNRSQEPMLAGDPDKVLMSYR